MNKKVIFWITVVLVLGVVAFFAIRNLQENKLSLGASENSTSELSGTVTPQEDGWSLYQNEELNLSFSYPTGWNLIEENQGTPLYKVTITGEGYTLTIDGIGRGIPDREYDNPEYSISGAPVERAYEAQTQNGFEQIFLPADSVCNGLNFFITSTASKDKEITDRFLDSIVCASE
ncbi:MAG TPA: hypothetical protein VNU25_02550 [Candidatus Paceibacterota bacterium]|nr:hypothetical protein [Candidatus Paceibacterota bacterium]